MANPVEVIEGREIPATRESMAAILNQSEIDTQIATAKRFPRSVTKFIEEAKSLACLDEQVAAGCMYALPRDGKKIEGPSARFAEIVMSCWGNCRAGGRVVAEERDFVVSQGSFMDLERNTAVAFETKRRITTSDGRRYGDDMIGVTGNAATAIVFRNAVLKGIPKAFWSPVYDAVRKTIIGEASTLKERRGAMLADFMKMGVTEQMIFGLLDVKGIEDVTGEHMLTLKGVFTAIKDGETTVDQQFPTASAEKKKDAGKKGSAGLKDDLGKKKEGGDAEKAAGTEPVKAPTADEIVSALKNAADQIALDAIWNADVKGKYGKKEQQADLARLSEAYTVRQKEIAPPTTAAGKE